MTVFPAAVSSFLYGKRTPQKLYKTHKEPKKSSIFPSFGLSHGMFTKDIIKHHKPTSSPKVGIKSRNEEYNMFRRTLESMGIVTRTINEKLASESLKAKGTELQQEYDAVINKTKVNASSLDTNNVVSRVERMMLDHPLDEVKEDEMQRDIDAENGKGGDKARIKELLAARQCEIPQEELNRLNQILKGPATHEVIIDKYSIDMTRAKLVCLKPSTWLNDEVINFYMSMLQERDLALTEKAGGENNRKSSHYFSSFFIDRLTADRQYNFNNIKRWTKKFDVFSKDKIFMPVNLSQTHWTMIVVYVQKREIHYYDSMSGNGMWFLQQVLSWLSDEMKVS